MYPPHKLATRTYIGVCGVIIIAYFCLSQKYTLRERKPSKDDRSQDEEKGILHRKKQSDKDK